MSSKTPGQKTKTAFPDKQSGQDPTEGRKIEDPGAFATQVHLGKIIHRAKANPRVLTAQDVVQLHRTLGNKGFREILHTSAQIHGDRTANAPLSWQPILGKSYAPSNHGQPEHKLQSKQAPATSQETPRLASVKAATYAARYGRPDSAPPDLIQLRRSNGISVSRMRFKPRSIPADGKTTTLATVRHTGHKAGGGKLKWSIEGPAFGSTIDAAGRITPGVAIKKGADRVRLKIKAEDTKNPGAYTYGRVNLWDAEYFQAKLDYPKFRALKLGLDPFPTLFPGKFAITYRPRRRRFDATLRVSFTFLDDKAGAVKWNRASKRAFRRQFIRIVQRRWSNQYRFENVREPQKIWRRLNPVRVRIRVREDNKAPHQTITVHKKNVTAAVGVGGVVGKAKFAASDRRSQPAFNPATKVAELAALAAITPTPILFAAGKADIKAADQKKLEFMATYLRRIKNPRFTIRITGHHQKVVHGAKDTAAQKRAANRQARRLSRQRANAVRKVLREGRADFHRLRRDNMGVKGAAAAAGWDKVAIASTVPAKWRNVQTTLEHEAGHMFGIDDEYIRAGKVVGDKTDHYALTVKAFGKQYADQQARMVKDSASLMNGGNDIRPHHYVTFWDGLAQLTSGAAFPKSPFTHKDWKFQNGT